MATNPKIAFDEAGNTGQNLLDPEQEIFVLASVYLSEKDVIALSDLAGPVGEIHFKRLKRSAKGRRNILDILRSPLLSEKTVKVMVMHKPFMVITKCVDLLVEELARRDGLDLYERGGNIAMSNVIYFVTPVFCGGKNFEIFLKAFVTMIRTQDPSDIAAFYKSVAGLYRHCTNEDYKSTLATIGATSQIVNRVLPNLRITDLDPAIPAFLTLCGAWDRELDHPFEILHDQSKSIAFDKSLLEQFMDSTAANQEVFGTDRRTINLPLRATGITFVDSASVRQVQIADLISSSCAYWPKSREDSTDGDPFGTTIGETGIQNWLTGGVWPTPEVDPKELGTDGAMGENLADGFARFLTGRKT